MVDRARRALSTLTKEAPRTKPALSNTTTTGARLALISKHSDALENARLLVNHDADCAFATGHCGCNLPIWD